MLAMLHALASTASYREVWWLYRTRNRDDHPFAQESRDLIKALAHCRAYICYSKPGPADRLRDDYDATGHLGVPVLDQLGVPRDADFYLCGLPAFLNTLAAALKSWGVTATRIHTEIFGPVESKTPGIASAPSRHPHPPRGIAGSWTTSHIHLKWTHDRLESGLPKFAGVRRSVRRSREVGVPDWRLPYMRMRADRWSRQLSARPAGGAGGRQRAPLLLTPGGRRGSRSLGVAFGLSAQRVDCDKE